MGEWIDPLNFKKLFLEYFLGSTELFFFALVLLISFACAKFGMSNKQFILILVIASLLFATYLGQAIYILILIVIGFISFKALSRLLT